MRQWRRSFELTLATSLKIIPFHWIGLAQFIYSSVRFRFSCFCFSSLLSDYWVYRVLLIASFFTIEYFFKDVTLPLVFLRNGRPIMLIWTTDGVSEILCGRLAFLELWRYWILSKGTARARESLWFSTGRARIQPIARWHGEFRWRMCHISLHQYKSTRKRHEIILQGPGVMFKSVWDFSTRGYSVNHLPSALGNINPVKKQLELGKKT